MQIFISMTKSECSAERTHGDGLHSRSTSARKSNSHAWIATLASVICAGGPGGN
jgi:hypothetical protein